jgi:NAD(P)-dependent dehydrogenase (short-subunit alcohol dehydrogenase family)
MGASVIDAQGWRVLITGGGSGIGLRLAELLVADGAAVTALDIDEAGLARAGALGEGVRTERVDVRSRDAVAAAVGRAADAMGGLDRVVNSAGIFRFSPFLDISPELWLRTLDINLTGAFHVCQEAIPRLITAGGGRIVNVASVAGVRAGADSAQYIASKWGLVGLTKALAVEFGPQGVIVNAVAPASIPETAIGRSSLEQKIEMGWGSDVAETLANQARNYPLRRLGTADDVARGIRYLLSDDAACMTGQVLSMDGGATAS